MEKHLHIVSFDVPYPADYGGVIDVYFKIKTLHQLGIKIHLHCFEYGRPPQEQLNTMCEQVYYYRRCEGHKGFSHKFPYIVCSRSNKELSEALLNDNFPILLEGIHCTYLLHDARFDGRKIILRLHNVEYKYYRQLFRYEKSPFKKLYYLFESRQLKKYEKSISAKALILTLTHRDADTYRNEFGIRNVFCLPAFSPFEKVQNTGERGCFCLYHGNLSVVENEAAAIWLLKNVFKGIKTPFVIAGRGPSPKLIRAVNRHTHACIIADPSDLEMQDMVSKAQINILPSFNCTGVKMKLLNALFNGKHCIVNEEAVSGTPLRPVCHICQVPDTFKESVGRLYDIPFSSEEADVRQRLLSAYCNNLKNGEELVRWIW